jgi:hypothetical protein
MSNIRKEYRIQELGYRIQESGDRSQEKRAHGFRHALCGLLSKSVPGASNIRKEYGIRNTGVRRKEPMV